MPRHRAPRQTKTSGNRRTHMKLVTDSTPCWIMEIMKIKWISASCCAATSKARRSRQAYAGRDCRSKAIRRQSGGERTHQPVPGKFQLASGSVEKGSHAGPDLLTETGDLEHRAALILTVFIDGFDEFGPSWRSALLPRPGGSPASAQAHPDATGLCRRQPSQVLRRERQQRVRPATNGSRSD